MSKSKLSLQVLAVTMNQQDHLLLDKMNIQSDVLVGNQCHKNDVEHFKYKQYDATIYSWNERGVGLNRNNLIMRATADIILFADDDVVYSDKYAQKVIRAFEDHPEADMITFNVIPLPHSIDPKLNTKWRRIGRLNCLKYGAPRMAVRLDRLKEKGVYFSLLFGGGAVFSSGEDSLFIIDCLKKGMKVYACPEELGTVSFETSTWFRGLNEKYFRDKGIFFYFLSKRLCKLLCAQYCVRHRKLFAEHCSVKKAYRLMIEGIKKYKAGEYGE